MTFRLHNYLGLSTSMSTPTTLKKASDALECHGHSSTSYGRNISLKLPGSWSKRSEPSLLEKHPGTSLTYTLWHYPWNLENLHVFSTVASMERLWSSQIGLPTWQVFSLSCQSGAWGRQALLWLTGSTRRRSWFPARYQTALEGGRCRTQNSDEEEEQHHCTTGAICRHAEAFRPTWGWWPYQFPAAGREMPADAK